MQDVMIETRKSEATVRVVVHGELDLSSSPQLHEAIAEALESSPHELVVDITGVQFLDCTAVGTLLQLRGDASSRGCRLRLTGAAGVVLEILEIAGAAKRLGVYAGSEADAGERNPRQLVTSMLDTMSQLEAGSDEH